MLLQKYRRARLLHKSNVAFQALKDNKEEWHLEQQERAIWDTTLLDDLRADAGDYDKAFEYPHEIKTSLFLKSE